MNIVVNSTFNPYTYKDLMEPIYDYKKAYEEVEAQYADLIQQTEAWKDIANRENSPEAYAMYQSFSNQLNSIVADFSRGMNPRNRSQLLDMKRRYAQDITPIKNAAEAMKEANKELTTLGKDYILGKSKYNSVDAFLHGKTPDNVKINRKELQAETAAITQAAFDEMAKNDPYVKKVMDDTMFQVVTTQGGSMEDYQAAVMQALGSNPLTSNKFSQIRQAIAQRYGYNRLDQEGQEDLSRTINLGMTAGLQKSTVEYKQNAGYESPSARATNARARAKEERDALLFLAKYGDEEGKKVTVESIREAMKEEKEAQAAAQAAKNQVPPSKIVDYGGNTYTVEVEKYGEGKETLHVKDAKGNYVTDETIAGEVRKRYRKKRKEIEDRDKEEDKTVRQQVAKEKNSKTG